MHAAQPTSPVTAPVSDGSLEDLRRRRAELRAAMTAVETALASPAAGRVPRWAERVHVALLELSADLRVHVDVTEGARGLHRALVATAPRLAGPVDRLARDHVRLHADVEELTRLASLAGTEDDVPELRVLGVALLSDLARHRRRGSELVWQAYAVDIGGER